jgi:predicted protein tyrosine phosphatase
MTRLLFICSRNKLRSPTAERVFGKLPAIEADSAGLAPDAETPLTAEQVEWAEVIFVMEKSHRAKLTQRFKRHLNGKKLVCLDVPDNYTYMQPELIELLRKKVLPLLR